MTLDELKALIEAEALRRQATKEGFTLDAVKAYLGQPAAMPAEIANEAPAPPEPLTYAYFKALNGERLVAACYSLLLGRSGDAAGTKHFVEQLARGADKALIVGSVAYSPEGRQRKVRVGGLLPPFLVAAGKRVPVAGSLLGWVVALATLNRRQRDAQAFEHRVNARLDALAEYVARSGTNVAMRIDALRTVMESRD